MRIQLTSSAALSLLIGLGASACGANSGGSADPPPTPITAPVAAPETPGASPGPVMPPAAIPPPPGTPAIIGPCMGADCGDTPAREVSATCGDGVRDEKEACDDGNQTDGDGCAADCRASERGFSCAVAGSPCLPLAICGDGLRASSEQCDDGNMDVGDGCDSGCKLEVGMKCDDATPNVCTPTTCGDGIPEGAESCDDGNKTPFDGCTEQCLREPTCDPKGGACTSECGDGLVIDEACDDGNRVSGDGCSSECEIEEGFTCVQTQLPCVRVGTGCILRVPAIFRDFSETHPDFGVDENECKTVYQDATVLVEDIPANVLTLGLVQSSLTQDGRPQLAEPDNSQQACASLDVPPRTLPSYKGIEGAASFDQWFKTDPAINNEKVGDIVLFDNGRNGFVNRFGHNGEQFQGPGPMGALIAYDGNPLFFPVDDIPAAATPATRDPGPARIPEEYGYNGWPLEADVFANATDHNFYFTTEVQTWFEYSDLTNATLEFTGDDDVWVYVNGILAVDLGGIHAPEHGVVTINPTSAPTFGLEQGKVYQLSVFQAERRMEGSSFRLTLSGFENNPSECKATCGDGIVAFGEECDDGVNDGGYGECDVGCRIGAYCGDGIVQEGEDCDEQGNGCSGCRFFQLQ